MWFKDTLIAQLHFLEREKDRIQNQIRVLPKGTLVKKTAKGKKYFYLRKGKSLVSLRKEEKLRNEYLFRDTLQRQLEAINFNIPVIQRTIKGYRPLAETNSNWASISFCVSGKSKLCLPIPSRLQMMCKAVCLQFSQENMP